MAVFLCHLEEIAYLCTVELQDEFTAKMHSEFFVDEETDRKHRAGCVWRLLGFDATKADIEHWAACYGVAYADCRKWRSFWKNLHDNSKKLASNLAVSK
ncbi:MAG: hypothetical protein IJ764_00025 [Bacteroidales bacterium]|nr:hypothetical protein [Bacteroidales bacterium]